MKIYNKVRVLFLLMTIICCLDIELLAQSEDQIDCMVDFAYPVSTVQSARNDLSQAVYSVQQNDIDQVAHILQNALAKLVTRKVVDEDDCEYIQDMINQINALIESLEHPEKSIVIDLCQQLQDKI